MKAELEKMNCWKILGIEQTTDQKIIKEAYASKIKENHPEDSMDDFIVLREAYKQAIQYAKMKIKFKEYQQNQQENSESSVYNDQQEEFNHSDSNLNDKKNTLVNEDEENVDSDNNDSIVIDFDKFDKPPITDNSKPVFDNQEESDRHFEKALIDDFYSNLKKMIMSNKNKDELLWNNITSQWFFMYFRNLLYFQESFWTFFYAIKFFNISAPTRKYIILPFLNDFLLKTDYRVALRCNAEDTLMRCSSNLSGKTKKIKSENLFKPRKMLFKKHIFKYRSVYILLYEVKKAVTILGWILIIVFITFTLVSLLLFVIGG